MWFSKVYATARCKCLESVLELKVVSTSGDITFANFTTVGSQHSHVEVVISGPFNLNFIPFLNHM